MATAGADAALVLRTLVGDAFKLMTGRGVSTKDAALRIVKLQADFRAGLRTSPPSTVAERLLGALASEGGGTASATHDTGAPAATAAGVTGGGGGSEGANGEAATAAAAPALTGASSGSGSAQGGSSAGGARADADEDMAVSRASSTSSAVATPTPSQGDVDMEGGGDAASPAATTSGGASGAGGEDAAAAAATSASGGAGAGGGGGGAGAGAGAGGGGSGGAGGPPGLFEPWTPKEADTEGISLARIKELMEAARASSVFREVITVIGRVCCDPDRVSISFLKEDGTATAPTKEDSGVDVEAIGEFYSMITATEGPGNALAHSLKTLVSELDMAARTMHNAAQLRPFLFALLNPRLEDPDLFREVATLCTAITKLNSGAGDVLRSWLARVPERALDHMVGVLQQFITVTLLEGRVVSKPVKVATKVLQLLSEANDLSQRLHGKHTVPFTSFYNDVVNEEVNLVDDYDAWQLIRAREAGEPVPRGADFAFCCYPALLDAHSKSRILNIAAQDQMRKEFRDTMLRAMFTGSGEQPYLILAVSRETIIQDSLAQLAAHDPSSLRKPLKVRFEGEEGIDEGGVRKEWFSVLCRELLDPKYAMFSENDETRLMWFRNDSLEAGIEFELVGTLLGLAIYNDVILDVHFPLAVYRKLLGLPMELADVEEVFPAIAKSMREVLKYEGNVEEDMGLAFDVIEEYYGSTRAVELKPGGSDIAVTNENREEWVELYIKYLMVDSVKDQYKAFARGFHKLASGPTLQLFRPAELELLVCGSQVLDFEALETEAATYQDGFSEDSPTVRYFWEVVHTLSPADQRKLLAFVTGSDRAPIRGLGHLKFVISRAGPDSDNLPTSHTCFNHLLLPEYSDRAKLEAKLRAAITQSEGFGLL
uniref:HECT-type E3 ubiquitin transferase n=1 Tax=Bicosoecida sp. CB-2014 TaxID=1486930 RepID=A0A7S1CPI5_9STRA|mmetsp:Transcript_8322/g.29550  ORF Transcript_8322/g.29550 Transcript_8322/m.29550 type:complete len:884 (+) Transcript_8322:423-3074(+)